MQTRPVAEVDDPRDRHVILELNGLRHILSQHPEMGSWIAEALTTVAAPDQVMPDPEPARERYYRRGTGPSKWMVVVVDFNDRPGRIVTAFGLRKGPGRSRNS